MQTNLLHTLPALLLCLLTAACSHGNGEGGADNSLPDGKALYLPEEYAGQDWHTDDNEYSYRRMACTDNLAIFWGKGFGKTLAQAPPLEGNDMTVDLPNLERMLERCYLFFRDTLQFVKPGSLSEKYRMMVMVNYSLEGTAYGGTMDDKIGALWVTPNRLKDPKLNVIAHELGHSFQLQIIADKAGAAWGGSTIYESGAQWMLWQINPDWVTDENYHFQAYKASTHKAFLSPENMYRAPYVLEYWSGKHGVTYIGELFRQGTAEEDPVLTHQRLQKLTQESFNDELFEARRHQVNFDFPRVYAHTRQWANTFDPFAGHLADAGKGWLQVSEERAPEDYGFNPIPLEVPAAGGTVSVQFKGLADGERAGWRYGFVGVTQAGESRYSDTGKAADGTVRFTTPAGAPLAHLWLVVMGAPKKHEKGGQAAWPYQIKLTGSHPL